MLSRIALTTLLLIVAIFLVYRHTARNRNSPSPEIKTQARELFDALSAHNPEPRGGGDTEQSPNEIVPGLFLGSIKDANPETYRQLGITAVVNMVAGLRLQVDGGSHTSVLPLAQQRLNIPALDNPFYDLAAHFTDTFAFIDTNLGSNLNSNLNSGGKSKGKVLVHCYAGVSRSAAIVASYLQRKYGWSTERALFYIKGIRPQILPNEGFIEQLIQDAASQPGLQ